jgi:hypothetical protein
VQGLNEDLTGRIGRLKSILRRGLDREVSGTSRARSQYSSAQNPPRTTGWLLLAMTSSARKPITTEPRRRARSWCPNKRHATRQLCRRVTLSSLDTTFESDPELDTGSLRGDLLALLRRAADLLEGPAGTAIRAWSAMRCGIQDLPPNSATTPGAAARQRCEMLCAGPPSAASFARHIATRQVESGREVGDIKLPVGRSLTWMGKSVPRPSCGPRPQQARDGRSVGGRRACYQLTPAVHLDLVEDHRQVILHRVRRDEQPWR